MARAPVAVAEVACLDDGRATEERPAGTVTFLFTDIEGSTRLLESLGSDYASVLNEHRVAIGAAIERHRGYHEVVEFALDDA